MEDRKKKLSEFAGRIKDEKFGKAALELRRERSIKTKEEEEIIKAAVSFIDQLNTFNDFHHPEVHKRAIELKKAVGEYWISLQ